MNKCNPCNSSSSNGSYFCMTLCVAIATVATQGREIWIIQDAYWPFLVCQPCMHSRILLLMCSSKISPLALKSMMLLCDYFTMNCSAPFFFMLIFI